MNRSTGSKSESKDYKKILRTEEKKEVVFLHTVFSKILFWPLLTLALSSTVVEAAMLSCLGKETRKPKWWQHKEGVLQWPPGQVSYFLYSGTIFCLLWISGPEDFTFQFLPHLALIRQYLIFWKYALIYVSVPHLVDSLVGRNLYSLE